MLNQFEMDHVFLSMNLNFWTYICGGHLGFCVLGLKLLIGLRTSSPTAGVEVHRFDLWLQTNFCKQNLLAQHLIRLRLQKKSLPLNNCLVFLYFCPCFFHSWLLSLFCSFFLICFEYAKLICYIIYLVSV